MIFRFRPDEVEPSPAFPFNVIYRTKIAVWVGVGDRRRTPFIGLLDTGADDSKMTFSQAERLGVTLDRRYPIPFRGVRSATFGYFGEVTLEIRQSPMSYAWTAQVAFLPDPIDPPPEEQARMVLGHTSFFRFWLMMEWHSDSSSRFLSATYGLNPIDDSLTLCCTGSGQLGSVFGRLDVASSAVDAASAGV